MVTIAIACSRSKSEDVIPVENYQFDHMASLMVSSMDTQYRIKVGFKARKDSNEKL